MEVNSYIITSNAENVLARIFNPDYAIGIVASVEPPIKQAVWRVRQSRLYGEGAELAKLTVLNGFRLAVEALWHNLGLIGAIAKEEANSNVR